MIVSFLSMMYVYVPVLIPQHLSDKPWSKIRILKTHLTDRYSGIRRGEILTKAVKAAR